MLGTGLIVGQRNSQRKCLKVCLITKIVVGTTILKIQVVTVPKTSIGSFSKGIQVASYQSVEIDVSSGLER